MTSVLSVATGWSTLELDLRRHHRENGMCDRDRTLDAAETTSQIERLLRNVTEWCRAHARPSRHAGELLESVSLEQPYMRRT